MRKDKRSSLRIGNFPSTVLKRDKWEGDGGNTGKIISKALKEINKGMTNHFLPEDQGKGLRVQVEFRYFVEGKKERELCFKIK